MENENQRLRDQLSSIPSLDAGNSNTPPYASPTFTVGSAAARNIVASSLSSPTSVPSVQQPAEARSPIPPPVQQSQLATRPNVASSNDQSSYYGRTSTLFDDDSAENRNRRGSLSNTAGGLSDRTQLLLMGEAARQRKSAIRIAQRKHF